MYTKVVTPRAMYSMNDNHEPCGQTYEAQYVDATFVTVRKL